MNSRDEKVSFVNSPRFDGKSVDWLENFIIPDYKLLANNCLAFLQDFFVIFLSRAKKNPKYYYVSMTP